MLLSGRSRGAKAEVMSRWAETVGTPAEVFARFPPQETNPEAFELIDATVPLGIDSAPRHDETMLRPDRERSKRFRQLKSQSSRWLEQQMSKTTSPVSAPPDQVASFLEENRQNLDDVQELLLSGDRPVWPSDLSRLFEAPIPNLLGHTDLHKLLLIDCLAALGSGNIEQAERALESAWELGEILTGDPVLISQLVSLDLKRSQAAVVRHMPWLLHWVPRLDGQALRERIERALLYEGWVWPQYDFGPSEEQGLLGRIHTTISGPLQQLGSADASERWRRTILKLQGAPSWCQPTLDRLGVRLEIPMPWWNTGGDILVFDVEQATTRVVHAQIQFELTRKVLEMTATRETTGEWPVASTPWLQSSACPEDRWVYSADESVASIGFERSIESAGGRPVLSWEFSLEADSAPALRN
jgi:hypothetical protein